MSQSNQPEVGHELESPGGRIISVGVGVTVTFTRPQLVAVYEALGFRLADEIEDTGQQRAVYERARQRVEEALNRG